ncbi:MAG TPA: shikimate kinase [Papillibacter sp.]|jgi:shikimate dehydrogenase|nr:shikimate kinase [Papillibacter sp.]
MKQYGLLGEKLGHSFSPQIHSLLGRAIGAEYLYGLFEVAPMDLPAFLQKGAFEGLNVTIPYKKTVIPYCTEISPKAAAIGSVNTLLRRADGSLYGDNTDYDGFLHLLRLLDVDVRSKKCVILGSGGSSLTVRAVLRDLGVGDVAVISRSGEDNYNNLHRHRDAALLVNTTPVGMYPNNGAAPVSLEHFSSLHAVVDIIYNPARTALLLEAEGRGIPCINGLPMLVRQAARAAELFTGRTVPDSVNESVTRIMEGLAKNVLLIGMPGCGKSSVGAKLAEITCRPFFDSDAIIKERAGKPIPEIFTHEGEAAFRKMEHEVLRELTAKSGAVIATGGGIVKTPENLPLLRQNSVTVFLERPLSDLPIHDRPLSQSQGVKALYRERLPLYRAWSDVAVASCGSVSETALKIKELLYL